MSRDAITAVVSGRLLIVAVGGGQVLALDLDDGRRRWRYRP